MLLARCNQAPRRTSLLFQRSVHGQFDALRPSRNTEGVSRDPGPTELSPDGRRTWRLRSHGGRHLPLPPFMDPVVIRARQRWRDKKPDTPDRAPSSLQLELERNPHAHLLASPVRQCAYNQIKLPSAFLIRMRAQHIESVRPPSKENPSVISLKPGRNKSRLLIENEEPTGTMPVSGSSTYLINDARLFKHLAQGHSWTRAISKRLLEFSSGGRSDLSSARDLFTWDDGMSDRVLLQHQIALAKALRKAAQNGAVVSRDSEHDMVCILMNDAALIKDPTDSATPLTFSPRAKLGAEQCKELAAEHKVFDTPNVLAVRSGEYGADVCIALLRLQAFEKHISPAVTIQKNLKSEAPG